MLKIHYILVYYLWKIRIGRRLWIFSRILFLFLHQYRSSFICLLLALLSFLFFRHLSSLIIVFILPLGLTIVVDKGTFLRLVLICINFNAVLYFFSFTLFIGILIAVFFYRRIVFRKHELRGIRVLSLWLIIFVIYKSSVIAVCMIS